MTISFELPREIVEQVRMNGADLGREARELFLVDLYRQDRIAHYQLSEALGLSRLETDGVLKRHKVSSEWKKFASGNRLCDGENPKERIRYIMSWVNQTRGVTCFAWSSSFRTATDSP